MSLVGRKTKLQKSSRAYLSFILALKMLKYVTNTNSFCTLVGGFINKYFFPTNRQLRLITSLYVF